MSSSLMRKSLGIITCCALAITGCTYSGAFWRGDVTRYSLLVKHRISGPVLVTRVSLAGDISPQDISLGDSALIAAENGFSLRVVKTTVNGEISQPPNIYCGGEFNSDQFAPLISRMSEYLQPLGGISDIRFEVIPIPQGHRYQSIDTFPIKTTLRIRLAFALPRDSSECRQWWIKTLYTFVHEYSHAHMRLTRFETPNLMSEEVIAYSIMRCAALAIARPDELRLTSFEFPEEGIPFTEIYNGILSAEDVGVGLRGKGLADLHLFALFGQSTEHQLDGRKELSIQRYCKHIVTIPIDFQKGSYFDSIGVPTSWRLSTRSYLGVPTRKN